MSALTIVMYHYVRPVRRSRYPRIKGLETEDFRGQIDYVRRHYNVVTAQDLMHAVATGDALPPRALLLTFDDGYLDHYSQAFPILHRHGLQGSFFPPAQAIAEHRVLNVNKIHFVLAAVEDPAVLLPEIRAFLDERAGDEEIDDFESYWQEWAKPSRYDPAPVIFIKRMMQRAMPRHHRDALTDRLFRKYVSSDEEAFARELYATPDQLRTMIAEGMYVGSHGYLHDWLDSLSPAEQEVEVDHSLAFLDELGAPTDDWIMCYPFGGYNDSLLRVLARRGCRVGLTTTIGVAQVRRGDSMTLHRLDTNDLPFNGDAGPVEWTQRVM